MGSAVQTLKGETQRKHVDLTIIFAVLKRERSKVKQRAAKYVASS
jgi:hypothetical protein